MSIYKRNDTYHVKIYAPGGVLIRRSTGTQNRRKAQEYHDKLKAQLWDQSRLGVKPKRSWDEAALKWLQEKQGTASYRTEVQRVRWLTKHLRGRALDEITRDYVDDLLTKKLTGVNNRTRDLYLAVIRGILRRAMLDWEWIDKVPSFRIYQGQSKTVVRFLSDDAAHRLLAELPEHTRRVAVFSLATGLRMSNALSLRWEDVDLLHRKAVIGKTKNGDPLQIPLNQSAIEAIAACAEEHPEFVFTYKGNPIKTVSTKAWRAALKRAGITKFRWHDLRHTWATWHRQNGTPDWALQKLGGWKSNAMVNRYAHATVEHLKGFAENVGTIRAQPSLGSEEAA